MKYAQFERLWTKSILGASPSVIFFLLWVFTPLKEIIGTSIFEVVFPLMFFAGTVWMIRSLIKENKNEEKNKKPPAS